MGSRPRSALTVWTTRARTEANILYPKPQDWPVAPVEASKRSESGVDKPKGATGGLPVAG